MEVGEKLKNLRKEKKITQQKLADDIFVSRSSVAKWENGLGLPSDVNFAALCDYFGVERTYFCDPVTQEELVEKNRVISRYSLWTKISAGLLAALILLAILCPIFEIHIFTLSLKDKYTARVDCIGGYYVAVCDEYLCCSIQDGIDVLSFGDTAENETDYIWKHPEMLDVKAYRRFLCFSKQAEDEIYFLLSEDGSVKYGTVYVLRSPLGKVHYYYRRFCGNMKAEYFDGISSENIVFSCEGKTYDLKHHCSFVSDIDFTKGRDTLCVNGEPCVFSPILPY